MGTENYGSSVEFMLKGMPEMLKHFPGKGNIAINVYSSGNCYIVQAGERVGQDFVRVMTAPSVPLPKDKGLAVIADEELLPFGEKARIFDVFIEGTLTREAVS